MPLSRVFSRPLRTGALSLLLPLLLAVGCAQLPKDVERPVSNALAAPAETPLGALVQQRRGAERARFDSGFVLLNGPAAAYGSRLALVEAAQKTLDLQYYAIHADASTGRLLRGVVAAARRGVRVRVLLDDFHSTGRNALVMQLAFEPNIEMRMFNPVAGARGSSLGRMLNAAGDFDRVQQRMHNKLFIADNAMGVTGGRNLGDAYFGIAQTGNFVDVDVLAAGPIVQDMSRSFDSYWNNERAYPVQSLVDREELRKIRDRVRAAAAAQQERSANADGAQPPDGEPRPADAGPTEAQRAAAWDEKPLDLRTVTFVWAPAVMLADKPAKIAAESDSPPETSPSPALVVTRARSAAGARRLSALEDASASADGGETVVSGLLQLIDQAQRDLTIISPYFVPGPDMKRAFAAARARGVQVRVLTNSLASNDAPIAHVGYARHREELLAMGVELYEMRSEQASLGSALGASGASATGESRSMLHSKVLVMDGRLLVVGSMNLDLRSQLQNTELALLIRSAELSRAAIAQIESVMQTGAWRVEQADGGLVWRAPPGSGLADSRTEPDASLGLRLMLKLFGPLAPDELL
jgi:phosphatidylserine/phosphatidylglycerophosphate/cardiolipin synthase-like enzyme